MSNSGRAVDAGALQVRLPAGWTVETVCEGDRAEGCADGGRVLGYADSGESEGPKRAGERGAAFEIHRDGGLCTAIWLDRRGSSADHAAPHRITGVRERCLEWIVDRARATEEADGE